MLKKLYISLICLVTLMGCHDDFDLPRPYGMDPDGTVEFDLTVPAMQTLATRAGDIDENSVEYLTILVFDGNEDSSVLKAVIDNDAITKEKTSAANDCDAAYRVSFKINNSELRKNASSLHFYFLANFTNNGLTPNVTKVEDLPNFVTNVTVGNYMTMSGDATLDDSEVTLKRNGAKISVTKPLEEADKDDSLADLSNSFPFQTFATASNCIIISGQNNTLLGSVSTVGNFPDDISNSEFEYVNPTDNKKDSKAAFVIVKAAFNGQDYYYRLDFKRVNEDEESEEILNVVANHWYQFLIKDVTGPGASTPEEAAANPTPLIEYDIHDHSPVIYNMVSDGIRELGVNHEIIYSGEASKDGDWDGEHHVGVKLNVKLYSKNGDADYINLPDAIDIEGENDWLKIGSFKLIDDQQGKDDPDQTKDEGRVYEAEVWFTEPDDFGDLSTELTVSWHGLTRKVPVTWERNFDTSKLVRASLTIYNEKDEVMYPEDYTKSGGKENNSQKTIYDYFAFLKSEDEGSSSLKLYGVKPSSNNQKVRNEGFHFPVMYGARAQAHNGRKDSRWSYAYDISLIDEDLKSRNFKWELKISGSPTITSFVKIDGNPERLEGYHNAGEDWNFNLTRVGNAIDVDGSSMSGGENDYTYGTGTLTLTVTTEAGASKEYHFDLYHTGFFHKNEYVNHRVDVTTADNNYYYYEVVPIMGASRMRYWLDRNLGAKSAGLYIQATGEVTYYGDDEAAGGYYSAGRYSVEGKPVMYDASSSQADRVSPPGYRVPMQKVWNALRNSTAFDTEAVGGYFNSCYHSSVGDVFFPKSRYIDANGNHVGESRAGYYWTSTQASGVEKEETGRWLKVLSISGETTSYINGAVYSIGYGYIINKGEDDEQNLEDNGYAMSVRCINDIDDSANPSRTELVVAGATHVYLYRIDESGTRIATTTWPGHVIGNATTMSNLNNWFQFSYESDNLQPEDFYVIFNYVDDSGIIHSLGKNPKPEGGAIYSTGKPLSEITGWKVVGDEAFKNSSLESGIHESYRGYPTDNGYYWRWNHDNKTLYCYNAQPSSEEKQNVHTFRLWWPGEVTIDNVVHTYDKIWIENPSYNDKAAIAYVDNVKFFYIDVKTKNTSDTPDNTSLTVSIYNSINDKDILKFNNSDRLNIGNIYDTANTSTKEADGRYHRTIYSADNVKPGSPKVDTKYRIYWPYDNSHNTLWLRCEFEDESFKAIGGTYQGNGAQSGAEQSKFNYTTIFGKKYAYMDFFVDIEKVKKLQYSLSYSGDTPTASSPTLDLNEFESMGEGITNYKVYTLMSSDGGYSGEPWAIRVKPADVSYTGWSNPILWNSSTATAVGDYSKANYEGGWALFFKKKPTFQQFRIHDDVAGHDEWTSPTLNLVNRYDYSETNINGVSTWANPASPKLAPGKSKPQSAPRRKARSINQVKKGR